MNIFQRYQNKKLKHELKRTYRFVEQPYNTVTAYDDNYDDYLFHFYDNRLQAAFTRSVLQPKKWIDITNATLPTDVIMRDLATEYKLELSKQEYTMKEAIANE